MISHIPLSVSGVIVLHLTNSRAQTWSRDPMKEQPETEVLPSSVFLCLQAFRRWLPSLRADNIHVVVKARDSLQAGLVNIISYDLLSRINKQSGSLFNVLIMVGQEGLLRKCLWLLALKSLFQHLLPVLSRMWISVIMCRMNLTSWRTWRLLAVKQRCLCSRYYFLTPLSHQLNVFIGWLIFVIKELNFALFTTFDTWLSMISKEADQCQPAKVSVYRLRCEGGQVVWGKL